MSSYEPPYLEETEESSPDEPEIVIAEVVPGSSAQPAPSRRWALPLFLFIATCVSTLFAGSFEALGGFDWAHGGFDWAHGGLAAGLQFALVEGLKYAVPLMVILICHEMGHFLQARRYGVDASFPYFIPMPVSPLGTMGAVIAMSPRMGHRRALFDIGITGPLAGLVPTLIFCYVGLKWSHVGLPTGSAETSRLVFGMPPLLKWLAVQVKGPALSGAVRIDAHPMAFAGWVGLLITSLNLIPIGQLDGGHVLYALLRHNAQRASKLLLLAAIVAVVAFQLWAWTLMIMLLVLIGPVHPPTANDEEPLGLFRHLLGWATLAFIFVGFTPQPFIAGP